MEELRNKKTIWHIENSKMVAVIPFLPVIILTVNELNSSIKRQSGRMDKLHDLFSFCNSISVQRVHLDSETQIS